MKKRASIFARIIRIVSVGLVWRRSVQPVSKMQSGIGGVIQDMNDVL